MRELSAYTGLGGLVRRGLFTSKSSLEIRANSMHCTFWEYFVARRAIHWRRLSCFSALSKLSREMRAYLQTLQTHFFKRRSSIRPFSTTGKQSNLVAGEYRPGPIRTYSPGCTTGLAVASWLQTRAAGRRGTGGAERQRSAADVEYPDYSHNNMGAVFSQQGRLIEAITAFNEAIRRKPDFPQSYNNVGIILTKLGRGEEAVAAYRRALQLAPTNARTYVNLAQALCGLGDLDQAIEICKKAISFAPNSSPAYQVLGSAANVGRLDESLSAFDRAIELNPTDALGPLAERIFARHFHGGSDSAAQMQDQRLWDQRHARQLKNRKIIARIPTIQRSIVHCELDISRRKLRVTRLLLWRCRSLSITINHNFRFTFTPTL